MRQSKYWGIVIAGLCAGIINGLFGAGGGMVLVPLMTLLTPVEQQDIFPVSISMILPMCLTSLVTISISSPIPWRDAFPYLIGSSAGGILSGVFGKKIPVKWLHRVLGILILWGGIRYLC